MYLTSSLCAQQVYWTHPNIDSTTLLNAAETCCWLHPWPEWPWLALLPHFTLRARADSFSVITNACQRPNTAHNSQRITQKEFHQKTSEDFDLLARDKPTRYGCPLFRPARSSRHGLPRLGNRTTEREGGVLLARAGTLTRARSATITPSSSPPPAHSAVEVSFVMGVGRRGGQLSLGPRATTCCTGSAVKTLSL